MDRRKFLVTSASALGAAYAYRYRPVWGEDTGTVTLNLIVQPEPPLLVAAFNQQGPILYVNGKMFQSLLTYDFDLNPQPELAKSWEVSDDGLTIVFHLQENVQWHDGEPFTADDVVFSIGDMLPEVHARARLVFDNYLDSVEKLDDYTVQLNLKEAFPALMLMFEPGTVPMMPQHIYAGTDYRDNPANEAPIGTGPFMFEEWKRGSYIKLRKNPDYWKPGRPHLDELIFHVIPDSASRAVAYENGRIEALRGGDVDNVDVNRLKARPGTAATTKGWEMYSPYAYLIMNMRRPPFDNLKVRRALMHALDRQMIVDNIFFGHGSVARGPFAATELFYDPDLPVYDYDPDKAQQLIEESGINPGDYTINQLNLPYGSMWDRLGEYTRQVLEGLGFNVHIESTDAGGWASRTGQWDFDLTTTFLYQYGDPALGVERLYIADNIVKGSPFVNVQGYRNPELDKVWAEAAETQDADKRQQLYSRIQTELVEDVANGFLLDMEFTTIHQSRVKNLVTTAIGLNETFDDVYLED